LIKWIQVSALVRSPGDFEPLVNMLESLGLGKGPVCDNENARFATFLPTRLHLDVIQRKKPWDDADLGLTVQDVDTAFEIIKGRGLKIVDDHSAPEPSHLVRHFTVELPGGTRVKVLGTRVVEGVLDSDHIAIEGNLDAGRKHFGIVVSRFNSFIVERLLAGAIDGLVRCGAKLYEDIEIVRVPGAFEVPLAARKLAETGKYVAIICLGCLLRGDTAHYDVIVNEVTRGIGQSAQETGVPHAFGVLTCENLEQAIDRAGLKMGNKGFEAALAAVEMASLTDGIRRPASGARKAAVGAPSGSLRSTGQPRRLSPREPLAVGGKQVPRFARNDKVNPRNDKMNARNDKSKKKTKRK
jgi:6,7-dimethyl-8-ribityllumazine synthase